MKFTEIWNENDHETNAVLALCTSDDGEEEIIIIPTSVKNQALVIYDNEEMEIMSFNDLDVYFNIKDWVYLNTNSPMGEFGTVEWGKI